MLWIGHGLWHEHIEQGGQDGQASGAGSGGARAGKRPGQRATKAGHERFEEFAQEVNSPDRA